MPPEERARQGARDPTYLPREEWAKAGTWLEEAWRDRNRSSGLSKRSVLAAIEYEGGTNRLNSYFSGARPPRPKTLRGLCKILGLSYVEAVARYGYHREFISFLGDLVWLGEQWLEEDDSRGGTLGRDGKPASRLRSLRDTGVLHWIGQPTVTDGKTVSHVQLCYDSEGAPWKAEPLDPLQAARFLSRYVVGSWEEAEHQVLRVEFPPIEFKEGATVSLVLDPSKSIKQEIVVVPAAESAPIVLPQPVALAIMLAVLIFPRRGDLYKDEAPEYPLNLYASADALLEEAEQRRADTVTVGRQRHLHPLLKRALEALGDGMLSFDARRVVAAEHAIAWAQALCTPFTDYAQLAAFELLGEVGSSVSTRTASSDMPQRRKAKLPPIETLTTYP